MEIWPRPGGMKDASQGVTRLLLAIPAVMVPSCLAVRVRVVILSRLYVRFPSHLRRFSR